VPYVSGVTTDEQEVSLYVEVAGSGPSVVLLHPWPVTSQSWERQIPDLVEAGFQVITFDRRGYGWSSRPWSGYDYATLAGDIHAVVTSLGIGNFSLIGASIGGGEVIQYLKDFGDRRIRSIVLSGAILPAVIASTANPDGGMSRLVYEDYIGSAREYRLSFLDGLISSFYSVRGDLIVDEQTREHSYRLAADSSPRAIVECLRTWAGTDMRAALATVTVPTLVLHGSDDAVFPVDTAGLRTQRAIPLAQLEVVQGAPHWLHVSHPDEFNRAIISFLRRPQ
jgi:non-heme chloroperoxidase